LSKYDKPCHFYISRAHQIKEGKQDGADLESRDEFLADIIGQLIRLFAKSKTLSKSFQSFKIIEYIGALMNNE